MYENEQLYYFKYNSVNEYTRLYMYYTRVTLHDAHVGLIAAGKLHLSSTYGHN